MCIRQSHLLEVVRKQYFACYFIILKVLQQSFLRALSISRYINHGLINLIWVNEPKVMVPSLSHTFKTHKPVHNTVVRIHIYNERTIWVRDLQSIGTDDSDVNVM